MYFGGIHDKEAPQKIDILSKSFFIALELSLLSLQNVVIEIENSCINDTMCGVTLVSIAILQGCHNGI